MRIIASIVILLAFTAAANGQPPTSTPQAQPKIRNLTILSDDLATPDRLRIAQSLQGATCDPDDMQERVRRKLRDLGFYYAQVETPEFSQISQPEASQAPAADGIDVSIKVLPGAQYRFGVIEFKHATAFAPNTLRSQFPIEAGSLFNVTSVSYGLNRLRNLYQANGHINFEAIPTPAVDQKRHVVDLTIDLDEGKAYLFGQLILDGIEPHAGDSIALVASWASLQGKPYNPDLLKDWLASNWPSGNEGLSHMQAIPDERPQQVNFRLQFR